MWMVLEYCCLGKYGHMCKSDVSMWGRLCVAMSFSLLWVCLIITQEIGRVLSSGSEKSCGITGPHVYV